LNGSNDFTSNSKNRVENIFKQVNINKNSNKAMTHFNASNTFQTTHSTNTNNPSYRKLGNSTVAHHNNTANHMFEKKNASHTGYSNTLSYQKNPRKKIMINNKLNFNSNNNQKYLDDSTQQTNNNIGTHSNKEIIPVSENSIKNPVNSQSMKNNLVVHKPNKYSGPIPIELMSDKEPLFLLNEVLKAMTSIKVLTKLKEHFGFFCQKNHIKFYMEIVELKEMSGVYTIRVERPLRKSKEYDAIS